MKWRNKGHEFDFHIDYYKKTKVIYFYGCVYNKAFIDLLTWAIKKVNNGSLDVDFIFVDRDIEKQNKPFCGYPVISPELFIEQFINKNDIVITFVSDNSLRALLSQLLGLSIFERRLNLFTEYEFFRYATVFIWSRYNKLYLHMVDVFISSHCNVNCRDCCIQVPRGQKRMTSFENLTKNIDALLSFADYVGFLLYGMGDGLIYHSLDKVFDYTGLSYGDRVYKQRVVTNGTILPNEAVLSALHRNNVNVVVDDYRENIPLAREKFPKVIETLSRKCIDYEILLREYWEDFQFGSYDNSHLDTTQLTAFMSECISGCRGFPFWGYDPSKVFSCLFQTVSNHLKLVDETEDDFIDWSRITKAEFIEFVLGYTNKGYLSACTKCSGIFEGRTARRIPVAIQENADERIKTE